MIREKERQNANRSVQARARNGWGDEDGDFKNMKEGVCVATCKAMENRETAIRTAQPALLGVCISCGRKLGGAVWAA